MKPPLHRPHGSCRKERHHGFSSSWLTLPLEIDRSLGLVDRIRVIPSLAHRAHRMRSGETLGSSVHVDCHLDEATKASKTVEVNGLSMVRWVHHFPRITETPSFERLLMVRVLHHHFCLDSHFSS